MRAAQLFILLACLLCACNALDCKVKPAPAVFDVDSAWTAPLLGCPVTPMTTQELNGPVNTNVAKLVIPAGQGFPVHRHPGKEEHIYFIGGTGSVNAWLPGTDGPKLFAVKAGSYHYLPEGGIHTVDASKDEDLTMIVFTSPGKFIMEHMEGWPKSLDVPVGEVVDIFSFMEGCPPGQEKGKAEL